MVTRRALTVPAVIASLLMAAGLLAGCTNGSADEPAPAPAPSPPAPIPTPEAAPIGPDTLLAIDAVATAPDGAELRVAMRVQRSVAASGASAAELRGALTDACPEFASTERLEGEDWGVVAIDVVATAVDGSAWPADTPIPLASAPRGELGAAAVAVTGDPLQIVEDPAGELGPCLVPPMLTGAGESTQLLGLRHDFAGPGLEGVFWNAYRYGIDAFVFGEPSGVTLSDCTITRTELADELSAPEVGYEEVSTDTECTAGIPKAA